ncbi:MAG TPA: triose-phosphate isomerase [Bacteroidales bacterium]|jgi:triosephosphate isomerase|nr:triose-phosphate isomerase [Bacteroidales bacterium]
MRSKIVAGNWKMNTTFQEAEDLLYEIADLLNEQGKGDAEVIICPPSPYLEMASDIGVENDFFVGAQNVNDHESGAYTGEISAAMISSMGITHVILGHSERRTYYGENDKIIKNKIDLALKHELVPIYCCGEVLAEREKSNHFEVVRSQVSEALFHLDKEAFGKIIIAYEPVWAIGTGVTASPDQAQEMHAFIRGLIAAKYGDEVAAETTILYGGSCNAKNAAELFSQTDVDGGLIGGASLKAADFVTIVNSFK